VLVHTGCFVPGLGCHSQHCVDPAACVVFVVVVVAGVVAFVVVVVAGVVALVVVVVVAGVVVFVVVVFVVVVVAGGVVFVVVVFVVVVVVCCVASVAVFCSILPDLREQLLSFHIQLLVSRLQLRYLILVQTLMATDVCVIISQVRVPVLKTHWSNLLHILVRPLYTSHS